MNLSVKCNRVWQQQAKHESAARKKLIESKPKVTIFIKNATFLEQMLGNSAVQMNEFQRLAF